MLIQYGIPLVLFILFLEYNRHSSGHLFKAHHEIAEGGGGVQSEVIGTVHAVPSGDETYLVVDRSHIYEHPTRDEKKEGEGETHVLLVHGYG